MFTATLLLALSAAPVSDKGAPHLISDSRQGMGTRQDVMLWSADEPGAKAAIAATFSELTRLENVLSEWRSDSEISRLNQNAGKGPVAVGPDTLAILKRGKEISTLTHGAFSLTWAALGSVWDFSVGAHTVPAPEKIRERLAFIDDSKLVLDLTNSTATLPAEMSVGVGAIAEGYALERALAVLRQRGFNDALVFIGGDIVTSGKKGDKPWLVGLQDPRGPGSFALLPATDEAVTASGDYEKFFEVGGVRYAHILDPHTGMPAHLCRGVNVVAKDAMTADALATALMVMGPDEGMKLVESLPDVEAVFVDAKNQVSVSSGLKSRLRIVREPTR